MKNPAPSVQKPLTTFKNQQKPNKGKELEFEYTYNKKVLYYNKTKKYIYYIYLLPIKTIAKKICCNIEVLKRKLSQKTKQEKPIYCVWDLYYIEPKIPDIKISPIKKKNIVDATKWHETKVVYIDFDLLMILPTPFHTVHTVDWLIDLLWCKVYLI